MSLDQELDPDPAEGILLSTLNTKPMDSEEGIDDEESLEPILFRRPRPGIRGKITRFVRGIWDGPANPVDEPAPPITSLLVVEEFPGKLQKKYTFNIRVCALIFYLTFWVGMFYSTITPYLNTPPYLTNSNVSIIPLSCTSSSVFWKGKNGACGLDGEFCPEFSSEEVVFRCPALCDRAWTYSLLPIGDQRIKHRGYFIGGGRVNEPDSDQLTNPYRADSYPCGSAVHAGIISPFFGGCARVSYKSQEQAFFKSEPGYYGVDDSIEFGSFFKFSFYFKRLMSGVVDGSFQHCYDPRLYILVMNFIMGLPVVYLASGAVTYWTISTVGFWTHCLATDPPVTVDPNDPETLSYLISVSLERFLPTCFILYVLWHFSVKRTLSTTESKPSPLTRVLLWYPLFWIGLLNNMTFDRLPVDRLTWSDLQEQSGSILALAFIVSCISLGTVIQAYKIWLSGRFKKYLLIYSMFIFGLLVLAQLPGLSLRIHHYILAMVLIPGCSTRGRTAYMFQGILLGLFLSGAARWGLAAIAETVISLKRDDPRGTLIPPEFLGFNNVTGVLNWKSSIPDEFNSPSNLYEKFSSVSLLVNDIEQYVGNQTDSVNLRQLFENSTSLTKQIAKAVREGIKDTSGNIMIYLRIGRKIPNTQVYSDFSNAGILKWPSGEFTLPIDTTTPVKDKHFPMKFRCTNFLNIHVKIARFTRKTCPRRQYSTEPPSAKMRWFYAVDVPNSKPDWNKYVKTKSPEKFLPFSEWDSFNLEVNFRKSTSGTIEVNEDRLFEVDLDKLELSPIYWEGPVYEVRRGIWFDSNGVPFSTERTKELELGYNKVKPYTFASDTTSDTTSDTKDSTTNKVKENKEIISQFNRYIKEVEEKASKFTLSEEPDILQLQDGNYIMYLDSTNAVLFPAEYDTNFQIDVIRQFSKNSNAGTLIGINSIQRGYSEDLDETIFDKLSSNTLPTIADSFQDEFGSILSFDNDVKQEPREEHSDSDIDDLHMQQYLEGDYDLSISKAKSNREIDHLVLCIHGIGQILGTKYESVNFTHNINVLRNTMKKVYQENDHYKKLAYPETTPDETYNTNNRIQVLPISWRHKIGFNPTESVTDDNPRLPTLSQINVDGIRALRNVIGDVVLDVLLYYEPKYLNQILVAASNELNRVYHMYKQRNPQFSGQVHILGHSLGSAIAFDLVCGETGTLQGDIEPPNKLDFEIDSLFLAGSPVGIFKLLEGKNISGTGNKESTTPKCRNLYNIFHPCDPVAYRIEPLICPKFGEFKAEQVPFASRGIATQIKELYEFSDEITGKISQATKWFRNTRPVVESAKSLEELANEENALGDILTSIMKNEKQEEKVKAAKRDMTDEELAQLVTLNNTGRVDYCLPMGVLDISLISAVSAHISYFENQDTSG
ncbi:Uncharacterized protein JA1_000590 [Spathaspora sp. JA1]|nr:Uncharacterized protein JA1_000590 [Spathaspora sp. JA1]